MNKAQQKRFDSLYRKHVNALRRQGKAESTIDVYSRAVRRLTEFFDCPPDILTLEQLEGYSDSLVKTHSWSTVKVDRNGLQFFYQHILKREWQWVDIVKPPQVKTLPDVLTLKEIERLINGTRELRYQTFIFTCFSMGLRLGETLSLRVRDIDNDRMKVHVRQAKGNKHRFVTLPQLTLEALRRYWASHRHPQFLFPRGRTPEERRGADAPMDRGGLQKSFKAIVKDVGIHKDITVHSLRHCYGTLHHRCRGQSACDSAGDGARVPQNDGAVYPTLQTPRSCGHRACNQCQNNSTQDWLDRQRQKQLPVNYYMATFTLPCELRVLARSHRKTLYNLLIQCAVSTLKTFALNKKGFNAELGLCGVLHTHTRRLDYHPHVHIVVPGGGVHRSRREWRKLRGDYLFNGRALAAAFRGAFLKALDNANLNPGMTPKKWVAQCQKVGRGEQALQYLSRYLYRGVISNRHILEDDGSCVTFRYRDSKTGTWKTRRLPGEAFIALLLQHVLPRGFRRARDYGFLHGNAKALLKIVQWVLRVNLPGKTTRHKASFCCPHCRGPMVVCGVRSAREDPG